MGKLGFAIDLWPYCSNIALAAGRDMYAVHWKVLGRSENGSPVNSSKMQ